MIKETDFYGGARNIPTITGAGTYPVAPGARVLRVAASVPGVFLQFPPPNDVGNAQVRGPVFIVHNIGGQTIFAIGPDSGASVLIPGGASAQIQYVTDPVTGDKAIVGHTVGLGIVGPMHPKGMVVGGGTPTGPEFNATALMAHPAETWSAGVNALTNRAEGGGCEFCHEFYVATSRANSQVIERHKDNTWTQPNGAVTTTARSNGLAGSGRMRAFFFGGSSSVVNAMTPPSGLTVVVVSNMPHFRRFGAAATYHDRERVILRGGEPILQPPWMYHVPSDTYEHTIFPSTTDRKQTTAFVVGQRAYFCGGRRNSDQTVLAEVDAYDMVNRVWVTGTVLSTPTFEAAGFAIGGVGYYCGGETSPAVVTNAVHKLVNPTTWAAGTPMTAGGGSYFANQGGAVR